MLKKISLLQLNNFMCNIIIVVHGFILLVKKNFYMKILYVNQKPQFGKELENMYSYTCMHMYVQ